MHGIPEGYDVSIDGPYAGGLNPTDWDTDNDKLTDAYEIRYDIGSRENEDMASGTKIF